MMKKNQQSKHTNTTVRNRFKQCTELAVNLMKQTNKKFKQIKTQLNKKNTQF